MWKRFFGSWPAAGTKSLFGMFLMGTLLSMSLPAMAEDTHQYHNPDGHFTLNLPLGWTQLKSEQRDTFMHTQDLKDPPDVVFQSDEAQDTPKLAIYIERDFPFENFSEFVNAFNQDMAQKFDLEKSDNDDELDLTEVVNRSVYDVDKHKHGIYYSLARDDRDGMLLIGMLHANHELVQLYFLFPQQQRNQTVGTIRQIVDSFQFDPGYNLP